LNEGTHIFDRKLLDEGITDIELSFGYEIPICEVGDIGIVFRYRAFIIETPERYLFTFLSVYPSPLSSIPPFSLGKHTCFSVDKYSPSFVEFGWSTRVSNQATEAATSGHPEEKETTFAEENTE
jgi:hypothetical protein